MWLYFIAFDRVSPTDKPWYSYHSTVDSVFCIKLSTVSSSGYTSNLGDFGSFKVRPTDDEQRILSSVGYN